MVITRLDWRLNGDLLGWLASEYPGLPAAAFEAAYRVLADPDLRDAAGEAVEAHQGCTTTPAWIMPGARARSSRGGGGR